MRQSGIRQLLRGVGVVLLALVAACATPTMGPGGPGETRSTSIGEVLVDSKGMTLYTYAKDEPGKSNCSGFCAVAWPPAQASKSDTPTDGFTIVRRGDGSLQWAYHGMPLYGYFRDSKPGDTSGQGIDGVWNAAHP